MAQRSRSIVKQVLKDALLEFYNTRYPVSTYVDRQYADATEFVQLHKLETVLEIVEEQSGVAVKLLDDIDVLVDAVCGKYEPEGGFWLVKHEIGGTCYYSVREGTFFDVCKDTHDTLMAVSGDDMVEHFKDGTPDTDANKKLYHKLNGPCYRITKWGKSPVVEKVDA